MSLLVMVPLAVLATPRASQRVASSGIVAAARAQIDVRLGKDQRTAKVSVVGTPEDVLVSPGVVTLASRPIIGRWPRSRVGVPVDVLVGGHVAQSATVWFALDVRREVLAYAGDASLGTLATSLRLVPLDANVASVQGELVQSAVAVEGMRLRRAVLAGSIAVRDDFERVPDVDRQQRVQVTVVAGAIHMQTRGTANAAGNAGDIVPVLVDNAEAPVHARVTDRGVVEVVQ
ncbi:MAG: flagellar basal body P-ring formation chaperone FlgA [Rhodanobacter sp.]